MPFRTIGTFAGPVLRHCNIRNQGASERPQGRAAPSPPPPAGDKETWGGPAFP